MNKKITRIGATVIVVGISIGLILIFTSLGRNSKGPIENLFVKTGDWVDNLDDRFVTNRSSKKRAKSLAWFDKYRQNIDSLKNPSLFILGAYDNNAVSSFKPILTLEEKLEKTLPFIHVYCAWGSNSEHRFPMAQANSIHSLGSTPIVTWEPWLSAFDNSVETHLKDKSERDLHGLQDVADGAYDFYLETFAEDVKTFEHPVLIRLGHEMNDPYRYTWGPQNNTNEEFIAFWKYIVNFFKEHHVNNVVWIWSPHPAYGYFNEYYPGNEYVDWVGIGALNYGTVAVWSKWWSLDNIYGNFYKDLTVFNKPIMLTEFGSLAVGGNRAEWYENALCTLSDKYPQTKSVVFFHYDNDITLTNKSLNCYFVKDSTVVESIKNCISGLSK
jgi:beta-mannanase